MGLGARMEVYTDGHAVPTDVHRTYPRFPGKDHQPNGAGPWEHRYWPTVPMERATAPSRTGWWPSAGSTLAEGNQVLAKLPRFNQRLRAYLPVNPELDLGGLCIKECAE